MAISQPSPWSGALRCCCALLAMGVAVCHARPYTVIDGIETVRLVKNPGAIGPSNPDGAVSISPDGKRYLFRTVRGDVASNGVWIELFAGATADLQSAAGHRLVAKLFSNGLGSSGAIRGRDYDTAPDNAIKWVSNDSVSFLCSDKHAIPQVVRINVETGHVTYLTSHSTQVVNFGIGASGTIIYSALTKRDIRLSALSEGAAAIGGSTSAYGIFHGALGTTFNDQLFNTEWFLQPAKSQPIRLQLNGQEIERFIANRISFSPAGNVALINSSVAEVPSGWSQYAAPSVRTLIETARREPDSHWARGLGVQVLVDASSGASRPLWDAPDLGDATQTSWAPDGGAVLLAPTMFPPEAIDARGLEGQGVAVVNVRDGSYRVVPLQLRWRNSARTNVQLRWHDAETVEVTERVGNLAPTRHVFNRSGDGWKASTLTTAPAEPQILPIRIEVRQSLSTTPQLFAVDVTTGREAVIADLKPDMTRRFTLGRAERIQGVLSTGHRWSGVVFYPVNFTPDRQYPLVIQSVYGYGANFGSDFSLYGFDGWGTGPSIMAPYPGRALASRDIAVVTVNVQGGARGSPEEGKIVARAFEAAAQDLIAKGLVDPGKVGLIGFSRNGYFVEYALAQSSFPFAAAIAADNFDGSYWQMLLTGAVTEYSDVNGGLPFASGLHSWLVNAPAFNADKIRTPLRLVPQSHGWYGVFSNWEMFSRLSYLGKPVELYVLPGIEYGTHNTQNPLQILAVQQGSVDWFDFWLNGREDGEPDRTAQYERWRKLRLLRGHHITEENLGSDAWR